jgi:hypothetical protein
VGDDGGSRRENKIADEMQQSAPDQIADGSLDPIPLLELGRVVGHFSRELRERQRLGVEVEDLTEDGRLVAAVLLGGGRGARIARSAPQSGRLGRRRRKRRKLSLRLPRSRSRTCRRSNEA